MNRCAITKRSSKRIWVRPTRRRTNDAHVWILRLSEADLRGSSPLTRAAELGCSVSAAGSGQRRNVSRQFALCRRRVSSRVSRHRDRARSVSATKRSSKRARACATWHSRLRWQPTAHASSIGWLEHGAEFGRGGEYPFMGNMLMPFSLRETGFQNHWRGKGGDLLLQRLEASFVASGGRFIRGARARELRMTDGRCPGRDGRPHGDGTC